jgi:tRNA(fMet)-specific endonuclease VapC
MISLDTNAVIAAVNMGPSPMRQRIAEALTRGEAIAVSSIVLFELRYGIAKSARREHNKDRLDLFMTGLIETLDFDSEDAAEAGEIRAALERAGTPIGYYDVLIAGQARRRDAVLVTANTREFARVPGLKVEDWTLIQH